jgi:hypothetical protein
MAGGEAISADVDDDTECKETQTEAGGEGAQHDSNYEFGRQHVVIRARRIMMISKVAT